MVRGGHGNLCCRFALYIYVCVCVRVCERERERERNKVSFLCLIAYQPLCVIWYPNSCRRTVRILFNPLMGDKWDHTFPKGISTKVNMVVRLEFEPTSDDVTVQHLSYYAQRTSQGKSGKSTYFTRTIKMILLPKTNLHERQIIAMIYVRNQYAWF